MKEFIITHRSFITGVLLVLLAYGLHLAFRYKNQVETWHPDSLRKQRSITQWYFIFLALALAAGFFINSLPDSNALKLYVAGKWSLILFFFSVMTITVLIIAKKEWLYVHEGEDTNLYKYEKGRKRRSYWIRMVITFIMAIIFLCKSF